MIEAIGHRGVQAALAAALLFGLAAPLGRILAAATGPFLLAGLLCLGSGLGLVAWRRATRAPAAQLSAFGALLAVAMGGPVTGTLVAAGGLMALGVWLHLAERHVHAHSHAAEEHVHWHAHDLHHRHAHAVPVMSGTWHQHAHRHEAVTHTHPHYPDAHHRHVH